MKKILEPTWQSELPSMHSARLQAFLLHPGSFMTRIQEHGVQDAQIQIVHEGYAQPLPWEVDYLKLPNDNALLIREVLIQGNQEQLMFARTLFSPAILSGELAELADLQNRSLGSILFNHPDVQRSAFEFCLWQANMPWYDKVVKLRRSLTQTMVARRSLFSHAEEQLSLLEIFFPEALLYD